MENADSDQLFLMNANIQLRAGGERITLTGSNLGTRSTVVTVGGAQCTDVQHVVPETVLTCVLPPRNKGPFRDVEVRVTLGDYPQLYWAQKYLSYVEVTPPMQQPFLSNIGARSIDVSWFPPGDIWDHLTITGYVVAVREIGGRTATTREVTVGNVTTTTIVSLKPNTLYAVAVSSVMENQTDNEWLQLDLYGRRPLVPGAMVSPLGPEANLTATLEQDFYFTYFDANKTVNHSGIDKRASLGPTGVVGGEGHYGLTMVGNANLENCNGSMACCDGYNASIGLASCEGSGATAAQKSTSSYTCSAIGTVRFHPSLAP